MALSWTLEMSVDAPPLPQGEEGRLVAASRRGDPAAFSELVRLHHPRRKRRRAASFHRWIEQCAVGVINGAGAYDRPAQYAVFFHLRGFQVIPGRLIRLKPRMQV